jgi:prepilin-type N-terminal cleavage/methylation domain-containing protein/prepilin-type processing-associated H-X9-DG protein
MRSRESGFTLIEIMIVMAIIVTLAGMVMVVIPIATERNKRTTCANNLKQLGTVLVADSVERGWPKDSGAGFLLRLYLRNKKIQGDVKVFKCPGDDQAPWEAGSDDHIALFKKLTQKLEDWDEYITSYCGRNVRDYPIPNDADTNQALATDRNGVDNSFAYHDDGVNVLFYDGKVEFWDKEKLNVAPDEAIIIGEGGPEVLRPLAFKVH